MSTRPGYQNPHYKPHTDLGAKTKTDAEYLVLKDLVDDYLKHSDRVKQSAVSEAELRALDSEFTDGEDADRLWGQIAWDLGLTPTAVPSP